MRARSSWMFLVFPLLMLACGDDGGASSSSGESVVAGASGKGGAGGTGTSGQGGSGAGTDGGGSGVGGAAGTGTSAGGAAGSESGGAAGSTSGQGGAGASVGTGGSAAGSGQGGDPAGGAGGTEAGGTNSGGTDAGGSGGGLPTSGIFASPQQPHTFTYRIAKPYSVGEGSAYDVVGLDLFDNSKAAIASLQSGGKTVICYFSSTYEDWRPDFSSLTGADKVALDDLLAGPLDGWPGEQWVDLRGFSATSPSAAHKLLRSVMSGRIQQAKEKGCDAVDFDNVNEHENGIKNQNGEAITSQDQYAYNAWLAGQAHAAGMRAFLKNDLTQIADDGAFPGGKGLAQVFDGAINEQCYEYDECDMMIPFRDLQKPIFVIQYDYGVTFPKASHKTLASTLHLNVSYYATTPEDALQSDPGETFGSW